MKIDVDLEHYPKTSNAPVNNFYRVVDYKTGHVHLTAATFDVAFDVLVQLRNRLPTRDWRMEHIVNGMLTTESL